MTYDVLNRLSSTTNAKGETHTTVYDGLGNVKSQTAANGTGDTNRHTNHAAKLDTRNSDAGYDKNSYNKAGQVTKNIHEHRECQMLHIDSLGRVATHTCTQLNNINAGVFDRNVSYDYHYDGKGYGRLDKVTDKTNVKNNQQGVDTFYRYNRYGEIAQKSQDVHTPKKWWKSKATQSTVQYGYNSNGVMTRLITPKGNRVDYKYDNRKSKLVGIKLNGRWLMTNIDTDAAGRIRGWKWGKHNATYRREINNQNQIARITNRGFDRTLDWRYTYDASGRLIRYGSRTYQYDSIGQLLSERWGSSVSFQYAYDNNGNRTSKTKRYRNTITKTNYRYTGNRLTREGNRNIRSFKTGEIVNLSPTVITRYDYMGRKRRDFRVPCVDAKTKKKKRCNMWYDYNHKNERVMRAGGWADRQYVYDENSRLIGEYHGRTQSLIAEYIWLGDTPVAAIAYDKKAKRTKLYYIVADTRKAPARIFDSETKQLVWSWAPSAYGEGRAWVRDQRVEINLRFPGQYYDELTGLHYNHHRYYNPALGRYVEPDPIGLAGGRNPYVYAVNDPMNMVDSSGLSAKDSNFASTAQAMMNNSNYGRVTSGIDNISGSVTSQGMAIPYGVTYIGEKNETPVGYNTVLSTQVNDQITSNNYLDNYQGDYLVQSKFENQCTGDCINNYYGKSYEVAQSLNPVTVIGGFTHVTTTFADKKLERSAQGNYWKNTNQSSIRSMRQFRTLSQFRRFNKGMLVVGTGAFFYQNTARLYCEVECW